MKELELTLVVRNNLLKERRDELGLTRKALSKKIGLSPSEYGKLEALRESPFKIARELRCIAPGCSLVSNFTRLCAVHRSAPKDIVAIWRDVRSKMPKRYTKDWTAAALKIANFWRCLPEDLFPGEIAEIRTGQISRKLDIAEAPGLVGQATEALALPPDVAVERADLRRMIDRSLALLTPHQASIIRRRFGIGASEHTLYEVAEEDRVSYEAVRQSEISALRKLRFRSESRRLLKDFDHRRQQERKN